MEKLGLPDLIRIEGVKSKGYGVIPKAVMTDTSLSLSAKATYAYFRSLSGGGESVFPGRDRILHDLVISKDGYYKGLQMLKDEGYILILQVNTGGRGKGFSRNIYTLVERPSKYLNGTYHSNPQLAELIRIQGLDAAGYGIIPRAVMCDPRLKPQHKALYAYLSSFIGSAPYADLDPAIIQHHLGCNEKTYRTYIKQLHAVNYITTNRLHLQDGRMADKNRYYLNPTPDVSLAQNHFGLEVIKEDLQAPKLQNQDTQNSPSGKNQDTQISPSGKNQDTQNSPSGKKPDTQKPDTQKPDTQIQDTIINSIYHYQSLSLTAFTISDRLIDSVREKIHYQILSYAYESTPGGMAAVDRLVETVVFAMMSSNARIIINKVPYDADYVRKILWDINNTAAVNVVERYLAYADRIYDSKTYLLTAIFNELQNLTISDDDQEV